MSAQRRADQLTSVVLVRHGRTVVNAQGRLSGRHDPPLDDIGERQAHALAAAVSASADAGTVAVVSSPLQRCVSTAEIVASACGVDSTDVALDERFIEMDYGEWDGRPLVEVPPEVWRAWREDPIFAPPGGETLASVTDRVSEGLSDWATRCAGATLVISSHVSPIKAAVIWALGVGEQATWRMRLSNASVTRFDVAPRSGGGVSATVTAFNETSHLGAALR